MAIIDGTDGLVDIAERWWDGELHTITKPKL
jgi:hypothetical protein